MSINSSEEVARWQAARDRARERERFKEAEPRDLPCIRDYEPFAVAMTDPAEPRYQKAVELAKQICQGCPFKTACLADVMRRETGLRDGLRAGIVGGLTGKQRAKLANRQGCGVCGAQLPEGRRLYCEECATRGARDRALERSAS